MFDDINLLEQLINSGKCWLTFINLFKGMIKDTDEQPAEEIHRARSGRVPSAGCSVSLE